MSFFFLLSKVISYPILTLIRVKLHFFFYFLIFILDLFIYLFIYLCFWSFFFPLVFSSLKLPSPSNHHTAAHVHESFFLFSQSLYPLTSSPLSSCSPSIGLSLFCLLALCFNLSFVSVLLIRFMFQSFFQMNFLSVYLREKTSTSACECLRILLMSYWTAFRPSVRDKLFS